TRTHSCNACSYVADRDENAARNILQAGLKQLSDTVGRTEIEQELLLLNNASGENDLCLDVETQINKLARRKRKPLQ
ncbi:MAG: RNA-guided endonuclease TnpB family protein, partial [Xenococcus sp. (in: cyanobacteria)]